MVQTSKVACLFNFHTWSTPAYLPNAYWEEHQICLCCRCAFKSTSPYSKQTVTINVGKDILTHRKAYTRYGMHGVILRELRKLCIL